MTKRERQRADANWLKSVDAKLATYVSENGYTRCDYLTREDDDVTAWPDLDMTDAIVARTKAVTPVEGYNFKEDSAKLFAALQDACEHNGLSQINKSLSTTDGRAAFFAHKAHLFNDNNKEEKITAIKKNLSNKSYRVEAQGPFHDYVAAHEDAQQQLEEIGHPLRDRERVALLLDGIKCNCPG